MPSRSYRARRRVELSFEEQEEIVDAYNKNGWTQKELAMKYRIKIQLARDLVREARVYPEKRRQAKLKAKERKMQQDAIISSAKTIL